MAHVHYKDLIKSAPYGYAWHKIVLDDHGRPCDYVFLDVNKEFERLTGLKGSEICNRPVTEVIPDIANDEFDWIGKYGDIALNKGELMFEQYFGHLQRWYRVQAYSPKKHFFSTIFVDITNFKRAEDEQDLLVDNIGTQIWYLKDCEHYGRVNQAHADFLGIPKHQIQDKSLYQFLNKTEADICYANNCQIFDKKAPVTTEEWATNGKGERRLLRVTKNPKRDRYGNVEFLACTAEDITGRRRAKQALRQSEEKFRQIFQNSPLGIFHFSADGIITDCNENFVKIIGSERDVLVGLNMSDLPDTKVKSAVSKALAGDISTYDGEYESVTSGKVTPLRGIFAPIKSEKQAITGGIGIVEDITERKMAEKELKVSEQQLRSLVEGIDETIFVVDCNDIIVEFSQPQSRTLYRPKEDFLGKHLDDIEFPEPARAKIWNALKYTRRTGEYSNVEYYVDLPDKRLWHDMNITAARDYEGNRILIGVVRDVTRRKDAELTIREREASYRQLFEDSPVSLIEMDYSMVKEQMDRMKLELDTDLGSWLQNNPEKALNLMGEVVVCDVNKTAVTEHKADSKEQLLDALDRVFHEGSMHNYITVLKLIARGGTEAAFEHKHRAFDGSELIFDIHWSVMSGHESSYSRVIISAMNITDRKKAEALIQKNLREKNVLLSEIHHRVKNNMAVISSLLTLQSDFQAGQDPLTMLRDTCNRIRSMALVHELVYEDQNFAEIRFDELLKRLADNIKQIYGSHDKDISVNITCDDLMLEMNQSVPCTLLANELITNACLHAFDGNDSGVIDVICHKDGECCKLVVRDDGKGVADTAALETPESFGYTIIHGLVQQIGGIIDIASGDTGLSVEIRFKPHKPFYTGMKEKKEAATPGCC